MLLVQAMDRVWQATVTGRLAKGDWTGMRAGIAVKPGNAGGVKALTALARERTNICYT